MERKGWVTRWHFYLQAEARYYRTECLADLDRMYWFLEARSRAEDALPCQRRSDAYNNKNFSGLYIALRIDFSIFSRSFNSAGFPPP